MRIVMDISDISDISDPHRSFCYHLATTTTITMISF